MPTYPTEYDDWIADAVLTAKYHGARWSDGTYSGNLDDAVIFGQYEPGYGYLRLAQHIGGDAELDGYAKDANDAWRDLYSVASGGAVTGFRNYTDSLRLDWTENADTTSRDALIDQAVSAAYATGSTSAEMKSETLSREVAYAVLGYINSEVYCGEAHNSRMEPMVELMLADVGASVNIGGASTLTDGGHIEQWLGDYTTDADGVYVSGSTNFVSTDFAPFMGAITAHALSRHYDLAASINGGISPDSRIVDKLERLFDAIWNETWGTSNGAPDADSFYYRPSDLDGDGTLNAPDADDADAETYSVNNMLAFGYWWLYKQTDTTRHLTRGDAAFAGSLGCDSFTYRGASEASYLSKEFNELTRWTIDGLEIRAEGVGSVAFTSKADGNWSAGGQTTWNEIGVPGDGDTVTITHAITVDSTVTVGAAGATGTTAITIGSAGSLTITTGELICKGDIQITGSGTAADKLWVQRGGTLTMNAPSGSAYVVYLGTGWTQRARMRVGDSGTGRATVRKTGLGTARISAENAATTRGGLYGDDCDFSSLGSTGSTNAIWILGSASDDIFQLSDCTFTSCGRVGNNGSTLNATATCSFTNCKWTNSLDTRSVSMGTGNCAATFTGCSFDKELFINGSSVATVVTACYIGEAMTTSGGAGASYDADVNGCFIRKTTTATTNSVCNYRNSYFLCHHSSANPHGWTAVGNRNIVWSDNVIEYTGSDRTGDLFQVSNPTVAQTYSFTGNLLLPNGAGTNPGSFVSCTAAGANLTLAINHNTWATEQTGAASETGVKYGETYAGHAGMISSLKSNLAYGTSSGVGYKLQRMSTSTTQNIVSAANCTHNGGYNLADGSEYGQNPGASARGYNCDSTATDIVSSGQLGANDVEANPNFFDSTRKVATWYTAGLGNATTGTTAGDVTAAVAVLAADTTKIADLWTWVRAGWAPTNSAYDGTAHDSGDIGAIAYQAPGGSSYTSPAQGPLFSPAFSPLNPLPSLARG